MESHTRYKSFLATAAKFRAKVLKLHNNKRGMSQADIARKYGVSRQRIQQIVAAGKNRSNRK